MSLLEICLGIGIVLAGGVAVVISTVLVTSKRALREKKEELGTVSEDLNDCRAKSAELNAQLQECKRSTEKLVEELKTATDEVATVNLKGGVTFFLYFRFADVAAF